MLHRSISCKCFELISENHIVDVGASSHLYVGQIMNHLLGSKGVVLMVAMSKRPRKFGCGNGTQTQIPDASMLPSDDERLEVEVVDGWAYCLSQCSDTRFKLRAYCIGNVNKHGYMHVAEAFTK